MSGVLRLARTRSKRTGADAAGPSPRDTARRVHRHAIGAARILADALTATPRARERILAKLHRNRDRVPAPLTRASARRRLYRRHLVLRLTTDRAMPLVVALLVFVAAGVSLAPAASPVGAAQDTFADAQAARQAIGGDAGGFTEFDGPITGAEAAEAGAPVDDGTLYKPVAVDTTVQTSSSMLTHYTVKGGDTLTGIASRFGVSMMTVWWANKLSSKDSLHVGQELVIPPVNGLVVTVKAGDTLDSLAVEYKIDQGDIIAINDLQDPNLIVGQVLVLPGAKGEPMPTPKPTAKPRSGTSASGGGLVYVSGAWAWPVPGGYVSQYFHYGHYGVDIANNYGSKIVSPRAGTVVFAGWKSNGGGYQVWIYHGSGIYSGHHHMSAVSVRAGQSVSKGQQIGKVGSSGWATGPHDHFEVWIGYPWKSGSYRVNPLRYY